MFFLEISLSIESQPLRDAGHMLSKRKEEATSYAEWEPFRLIHNLREPSRLGNRSALFLIVIYDIDRTRWPPSSECLLQVSGDR